VKPSQIVVRLSSGLGNQLFQLTCGMALAARFGAELAADTTWFDLVARFHKPVRRLRLDALHVLPVEAFAFPRRLAVGLAAAVFDRWGRGRRTLERLGGMTVIQELRTMAPSGFGHSGSPRRLYLNGYWQTADHFLAVREKLTRAVASHAELSAPALAWKQRIARRPTGFLHIRRGDYAALVGDAGLLPPDYYHRAARALDASDRGWHWLVFAEDEEWARRNLGFLASWEIVSYDSPDRDIEDLRLMAACDAGIMANSSYSWWGAALGDRPGRPVIAPDRYWDRPQAETRHWVLPGWRTVPAWSRGA
jgi:hypothetical protein